MLRVLLTNDDGIHADGLQALGGAGRARGRRAGRDRARRQHVGHRPLDHHAAAAVGDRGGVRRRHGRLLVRRHAGRLRAARHARPSAASSPTSWWPASTTAPTSATTSPTRARSPPRSRGSCSACRAIAVSQQSLAREMDFRLGREFDFETAAAFTAQVVDRIDDVPLPDGTLLNINVPAGDVPTASRWRGSASGSTATRSSRSTATRRAPQALPDLRRRAGLPRRGGDRPGGRRRRPDRGHAAALRPHRRARARRAARLRPRAAAGAGRGGSRE